MSPLWRLRLSTPRQRQLSHGMELCLVGLLFVGVERGNVGIVVNTAVALAVTQLPPILEHDHELPMDPRLTLWITSAAFLHALGTVGLPGSGTTFYQGIWWWDHLTHALSASVVAAVGYATVRAIDEHSEDIVIPPEFTFVFLLLFVLAFGVLWEILEFAISEVAGALGTDPVLTQYSLEDTLLDLVFNTIGGVLVALWGSVYLNDVVGALTERLDGRVDARGGDR